MRTAIYCLLLLSILALQPTLAFHAEVNPLQSPLPAQQRLQQVYYQLTPQDLSLDDILADPAKYHAFTILTPSQRVLFNQQYAVWFFARLQNNTKQKQQLILEYDFPLADKVEFYQRNNLSGDIRLLSRSGTDYPYSERVEPYRSFVINLELNAAEQRDIFIRVQDAAIIPSELRLWRYRDFIAHSQSSTLLDGVLQGILLVLALYNLWQFIRQRQPNYLYYCGFFISFALVVAILNGIAFALLWPDYPEINQAVLYIAVGSALLCLNLFIHHELQPLLSRQWRWLSYISSVIALLLLFSPLFTAGLTRLVLLFLALSWVLCSNIVLAIRFSQAGQSQARAFVWACVFTLCTVLLLTLSQAGYLSTGFHWLHLLQLLVLFSLALTSFSLQQLKTQH